MELNLERKLSANSWIIAVRWLYMLAIFFIGWLTKMLGVTNVNFSILLMFFLLISISLINYFFYLALSKIKKNPKLLHINLLSFGQLFFELIFYTVIFRFTGGVEGTGMIYFIIPIVFSPLLFGQIGTLITIISTIVLISTIFMLEKFTIIEHISRYNFESTEFGNFELSLIKVVTFFIFYFIIGFLSSHNFKNLFEREDILDKKSQKLNEDYKKRESELKQLEEEKKKINSIILNFIDPIIFLDKNDKISLYNPVAKDVFGFKQNHKEIIISKKNNFSMFNFKKIFNIKYEVNLAKNLPNSDNNVEEIILPQKDDFEITYKVITAKVVADDGQYFGILKIFYNLTREKMIDRVKSEFISVAAHQLRTPLSAIKWSIKMVLDGDSGKINKEQQQILYKGYQSNERIIRLVNDMLNVSRIEEGRFDYSFEQTKIDSVMNYVVENLEAKVQGKKIKLIIKKPEKLPLIFVDKEKILLAFQNILENAVKYSPEYGTIHIFIEKINDFLSIKIKDNGVGIPKKDQAKLFSKFFRAENAVKLQTDGSGLGLFIAKNIIKKHGGTIEFKSKEGVGSEFSFTLPLNKNIKKKVSK